MFFLPLLLSTLLSLLSTANALALRPGGPDVKFHLDTRSANSTSLVTYDEQSLFVRGQRVLFYSGEFHPFRLPVPGLWLDIFQKIRALGYNGVSFYVDWALLEGTPGTMRVEGIFDLEPFFEAAQAAGIYLLARPGPYINAEAAGGGFPGWLKRNNATLRTSDPGYLEATSLYMSTVGGIIAKAQITNGGPVILVQPENEYSTGSAFPQPAYFEYVQQQLRNAGIEVPLISNDAYPGGNFAPGPPRQQAAVDIYGHDGYPLGFNCGDPSNWGTSSLPTNWAQLHEEQSSSTPYSIVEFQGGSFDPWGGVGFADCVSLLNSQFETVFYKNDFSFGVRIFNLYMTFGGTNWGNLGHPGGYSSYDYGAAISEERLVTREKYSAAKLLANSFQASPAYLTAVPQSSPLGAGAFTNNSNVYVSALFGNTTKFFVARQNNYYSTSNVNYTLTLPTSNGNITVPQLGGQLSINGRDSKVHVTDYSVGSFNMLYSTADIFTWQQYSDKTVLVVYAGPGETHELAFTNAGSGSVISGSGVQMQAKGGAHLIHFTASPTRRIVKMSKGLYVYIVERNSAYNYWVIGAGNGANQSLPIVNMPQGYLLRNVSTNGNTVALVGDLNRTTTVEVLGAPAGASQITFNGQSLQTVQNKQTGALTATAKFVSPRIPLPNLQTIQWKYIDSLPEIQPGYDDSLWPNGNLTYTNNTERPLSTPTSLYGADYGFHTGSLVYRGHFVSDGTETTFQLSPQGGYAYGHSVWINSTFIGSWAGNANNYYYYGTYDLPQLTAGAHYVFTVLIDHMGNNENYDPGYDYMKEPRGVMQYVLGNNRPGNVTTWKLTGNLGGENYADLDRGPLNEGGMWAERHGYHLPGAPTRDWATSSPKVGLPKAGVRFYSTTFDLNLPKGYDIPLAIDFGTLSSTSNYRCMLFVNGYQFGKYVSNIGPQTSFPVPQGIWNYQGSNTLVVSLWALDGKGASVPSLRLTKGAVIQSGYGEVALSPQSPWKKRVGVY